LSSETRRPIAITSSLTVENLDVHDVATSEWCDAIVVHVASEHHPRAA
jgi:hypothetical protein